MRSSIPKNARERVAARHPNGAKQRTFYYLDGQKVGRRTWSESGELCTECGVKDGKDQGLYREFSDGALRWEVRLSAGMRHGLARYFDGRGRLRATTYWKHGTGVDLYFGDPDGSLTEERYSRDGWWHGPERWFCEGVIFRETYFKRGIEHGIQREWNGKRLRRGFPKYFLNGGQVSRRDYLRACESDSELPPFRMAENKPTRRPPAC